ncbi:MAG: diguanylate cyclase [Gammaproteobacteria bacterium]|nr:diguanylate cyclase [Gammaproteobacteria bacterium]
MPDKSKKILVVDDNRAINSMLVNSLESEIGIEVVSALTLADAKIIVEQSSQSFFLAILDLNLPDAPDGEIVDYMLAKQIPSIVLTANTDNYIQNTVLNKGVIDFINKTNLNEIQYIVDTAKRLYENFDRKVLVVEDSDVSRMLLTTLLEKQNLNVFEAINGVQALKLLQTQKDICLIVTDYNMPKMDGIELIYNIRKDHSRDEIAVIGISSTNDSVVSVKLLKSGANDFIARPFAHEEFNCRINQNIDAITNYKKLRDATIKDYLTGLYNRKYIFETGTKLFHNAKRKNIQLTSAMIDIDHFKKVNDTHGHHIGDLALKHVSKILSKELRDGDILSRMGGEEFCILCINLDTASAEMVFNRARQAIEDNPLQLENLTIPITISIGYTSAIVDSLDQMINNADHALYEAKNTGRNKVVAFTD